MGVQGGRGTGRGSPQMISIAFKDMDVFSILPLLFNEPTFNTQGKQLGFQS